ncbi:MAG: acyloxyacyl hydrolase [Bacteroidales bacterium]|nr:acyloxyacyl hydrolase [Bacteroidales bacterium]
MKHFSLFIILIFTLVLSSAQPFVEKHQKNLYFFQPGYMMGRNVRNYPSFPKSGWRQSITLDLGIQALDTSKNYTGYYRYPQFGIGLTFNHLGNDTALGNEFSIMPFFSYNPFRNRNKGMYFRVGMGLSYFTQFYNSISNPENEAIGSGFTWCFQGIIAKPVISTSRATVIASLGYFHASNGHIQLPNFGLNGAALGLSCRFLNNNDIQKTRSNSSLEVTSDKYLFLLVRQGTGVNELGGTSAPKGGRKGLIYSGTISGGIIFKQHVKVRTGFTYRYYQLVKQYDSDIKPWNYSESANWFASNVYFFLGCEFLIGHFGLDTEGGLNLYKPFYPYFFDTFEHGGDLGYFLKKMFCTRMGLNYYLLNNEKMPKNNLSIGAHINANFGEADFSEVSFTYTRLLKKLPQKRF